MTDSSLNIGNMIVASARLGLGYAERLLKDVTADRFARFASVGGSTIESNHPCFILGHLSLYPARIVKELGHDPSSIVVSDTFDGLFNKDAKCIDDVDGSVYPAMDEVLAFYRSGHELAIEVLQQTDDSVFYGENPNEPMRSRFPTIGAMHGFYLSGHVMMHMGQFSAWRRMVGLGAA